MSAGTRRVLACVSIAVDVAVLIAIAIGVRLVHHGLAETVFIMALPVVSALCGPAYLRSARERP